MNKYKYLPCLFITLSLISCSSNNNITNLIHTEPAYLGDYQLYGYEKGTLRKNSENKYFVSEDLDSNMIFVLLEPQKNLMSCSIQP